MKVFGYAVDLETRETCVLDLDSEEIQIVADYGNILNIKWNNKKFAVYKKQIENGEK